MNYLVQDILALSGHVQMMTCDQTSCLAPVAAPLLPATHPALLTAKFLLASLVPLRIWHFLAIGSGDERCHAYIDAYVSASRWQRGRIDIAGEHGIPAVCLPNNSHSLGSTGERPMPAHGNPADPIQPEPPSIDLEAVAVLLETEGRETVFALEPRVPRFLARLYTPEEGLKCAVQIGDDHLKNMTMDIPCIWVSRFHFLDFAELLDLGDQPLLVSPRIPALCQEVVVELPACF